MRVVSLMPLPPDALSANLPDDLHADVVVPAERSAAGAAAVMPGADLVVGDYSGDVEVSAEVVASMDRVRLFHQPTTGYELVDIEACARAGIPVTTAGRVTSIAMGEHTVLVTLALLRSLVWCDRQVRAGQWPQHEVVGRSLTDLAGKTVGLIGLGGAGEEAVRRFVPFGCRLLYTARRRRPPDVESELGVTWADLGRLLEESDVVCLLTDLNPTTDQLIDADALTQMKPSAFLVNPSRGRLVDEDALVAALQEGSIAGAALDVFAEEPLPATSPLRQLDNVVLTPHTAGATVEARLKIMQRTLDVLTRAGRGELPDGVVNGVTALRDVR